jgi:hypothetical protein
MLGIYWVAAQLAVSQEGLSSMSEWGVYLCTYEYMCFNFVLYVLLKRNVCMWAYRLCVMFMKINWIYTSAALKYTSIFVRKTGELMPESSWFQENRLANYKRNRLSVCWVWGFYSGYYDEHFRYLTPCSSVSPTFLRTYSFRLQNLE